MPRGGARPGAGVKPRQISEKEQKRILKAINALSKITGRSVHDIFAEILVTGKYNGHPVDLKDWLVAYKMHLDVFLIKSSHKTVEQYNLGPRIGLPPIKEKPKEGEYVVVSTKLN